MKGLLIKDFRLLKGQVYFLLIVTGCVIVFMINGNEAFGVAYVCSMVALLSLTTVSYDEYENGSAFLFTLPITKKDYVKELGRIFKSSKNSQKLVKTLSKYHEKDIAEAITLLTPAERQHIYNV